MPKGDNLIFLCWMYILIVAQSATWKRDVGLLQVHLEINELVAEIRQEREEHRREREEYRRERDEEQQIILDWETRSRIAQGAGFTHVSHP